MSSCQSIDAGVTCGIGPTIISAAAMNSLARWPCVTITPPTKRTGSGFEGCESITFIAFLDLAAAIRPPSFGRARPCAYRDALPERQTRPAGVDRQVHWQS